MITLLNQPWIERLGWTLLHFLWQGILVAALYALARALAGGRISARGRYAIACASLLAMTAAPVLTYWWLGNAGQAARIGNLTDWGTRQLPQAVAYSPVIDPGNSRLMLFKLEPDGHTAKKVPVQFGAASVNLIEIKSGLQPGDKVIVSGCRSMTE